MLIFNKKQELLLFYLFIELNMSDYLFKPTEGYSEKIDASNMITFGEEYVSDEEMRDICRRAGTYRSEDYLNGVFISINGGHQHNIALYSKDCPTLADYKIKSIVNDDAIYDDEDNDEDDEYNQFYSDSYDAMYALEEAEAMAEARAMEDIEAEAMAEADTDAETDEEAMVRKQAEELEALEWQRIAEEDEKYRAELEREEREYEEEEYRRRYYPTEEELDEDDYLNDRPSRHLPKSVQRAMIYAQLREEEKRKSGWVRSKYGLF